MSLNRRLLLLNCCIALVATFNPATAQDKLLNRDRIVFLGDSITHAGGYVVSIEAAAIAQHPERHIEILNLGLPSETVSGLSEPGHASGAFPRPDLHERLERVLEQTKPEGVVACYGMNDGIYYPLSEERFDKFKSGIERLHHAVRKRGAEIVHLTPAFFDALPIQARLLPAGRDAYPQPYEGYDEVLETYAKWLLGKRSEGWEVIDAHEAMKQAVLEQRKRDPKFTFARDGVHPDAAGHAVLARLLGEEWGFKIDQAGLPVHPRGAEIHKLVAEKQRLLQLAWLTATGHLRPGIPAGLPLAEAQARAAALDKQARELAIAK